jgi:hypothetical protein
MHDMKALEGCERTALLVLNLSTRWKRVANLTLRLLYSQGKSPRHPLKRRLGGPQSRSGRSGKKKSLPVLGVEIRIVLSVTCHFNDHAIRKQQQQPS